MNRWRALVALLSGLFAAGHASAYTVHTDSSGVYVVKWHSSPVVMQVKLSGTANLIDGNSQSSSVIAAMQAWNAQLGTVQFSPQSSVPGAYSTTNHINEIVMDSTVDGEAFPTGGVLAITSSYSRGNDASECDIVFNTAYTWNSYRGIRRSGIEDIQRVAVHELGHVLGLGHPDDVGQTVSAVMNSHSSNVDGLQSDDIAGGQLLYGAPGFVPLNNPFASATGIGLSTGTAQVTGSNLGATKENGEPDHATSSGTHSVWWKWTAPASGSMTVDTLGSNFDTVLGVYTGSSVSALTTIGSNDDTETPQQNTTPQRKRTSTVNFNAVGGTTYYFAVDGWGSSTSLASGYTGSITLTLVYSPSGPVVTNSRLVNLSVRSRAGTADKTLIMGFVVAGTGAKQVLVRGLGPTLIGFGVTDALPDPQLKLFKSGTQVDGNDNWGGSSALTQTFAALGATPLAATSKDAALLLPMTAAVYSAHVTTSDATTGIALAEIYDADKTGARLVNVSARCEARTGDDVLVAGFVIEGTGSKTLMIRALGPTLGALGVAGSLADPQLKLFNQAGVQLDSNDNWGGTTTLKNAFTTVGAATLSSDSSKDSALLVTLDPGVYSAQVSGVGNTSGVALVEIYEMP